MQAQINQYLHELQASLPEEDALTFWSRRQAAYALLAPLAQDLLAAPASHAYVEQVFSVWSVDGLLLAAETDSLKIWRCVCVTETEQRLGVTVRQSRRQTSRCLLAIAMLLLCNKVVR